MTDININEFIINDNDNNYDDTLSIISEIEIETESIIDDNINYMYNDSLDMLDINTFNCIYSPYEKTVNTSLFNKQTKRIPNPIGKFNFYNFK